MNGSIEHRWTAGNAAATATWQKSATFGTDQEGKTIQQVLGLIESIFGFDLEVIALLSDGSLQRRRSRSYVPPLRETLWQSIIRQASRFRPHRLSRIQPDGP